MIKHIVMFKIKPEYGDKRAEAAETLKKALDQLPGKIDEIRDYEVGVNFLESGNAWDLVLISSFDGTDDLERYRVHPEHQKVVELIKEYTSDRKVVDYNVISDE